MKLRNYTSSVSVEKSVSAMEQVEAIQVFLPCAYDGKNDQTFFEKLKGNGFKQLAAASAASPQ